MNDILNVLQSLQLPFALFPILHFTNEAEVMSGFKNGYIMKAIIWLLAIGVMTIHGYLIVTIIDLPDEWWVILVWVGVGLFAIPYIMLTLYLAFKTFVSSLPEQYAAHTKAIFPKHQRFVNVIFLLTGSITFVIELDLCLISLSQG